MTDNVTKFPFGGHGTGKPYYGGTTDLPTECPDRFKSDNLRDPQALTDLAPAEVFMAAKQSRKEAERARAKLEFFARLDCMEAEIKSLRHMAEDLLNDDPDDSGSAA